MVDASLTKPLLASPGNLPNEAGVKRFALTLALAMALSHPILAHAELPDLADRQARTQDELQRLSAEIEVSERRKEELAAEVAKIRKDNASITAALIQAAKTEKKLAEDIGVIEDKLGALHEQEDVLRESLRERRGVLAEVLGALQRMGLNPPPAILVRPEDALASVRSAILLGAVVPELRGETLVLIADLKELSRLSQSIDAERERLAATMAEQAVGKERLSLLLEEKQKLQEKSEAELAAEQETAGKLAAKAKSLKDLIASLEAKIEAAHKAAEEARLAEENRRKRELESAERPIPAPNRLAAALPFPAMKGKLAMPVAGRVMRRFGDADKAGLETFGDTVKTQSGAIVTAPSDATVLYAGPFRSYGQLLILDAGDGYHVVLAGMGRIGVSQGQVLLAGEPVGAMGETRVASTQATVGEESQPELYIEFRKDQRPVDPAPWWLERRTGRTGHDS